MAIFKSKLERRMGIEISSEEETNYLCSVDLFGKQYSYFFPLNFNKQVN